MVCVSCDGLTLVQGLFPALMEFAFNEKTISFIWKIKATVPAYLFRFSFQPPILFKVNVDLDKENLPLHQNRVHFPLRRRTSFNYRNRLRERKSASSSQKLPSSSVWLFGGSDLHLYTGWERFASKCLCCCYSVTAEQHFDLFITGKTFPKLDLIRINIASIFPFF